MHIEPDIELFKQRYESNTPQIVWTKLIADTETPISAMLKLKKNRKNTFLLESVEGGAVRGRYSIIGLDPDLIFRAHGEQCEICRNPVRDGAKFEKSDKTALEVLSELLDESRIDIAEDLPPMAAGIFGYLGYDTIRYVEDIPSTGQDILDVPDALLARPSSVLVFDGVKDELYILCTSRPNGAIDAKDAYEQQVNKITDLIDELDEKVSTQGSGLQDNIDLNSMASCEMRSNMTPESYMEMVRRAKQYIYDGDIFQVVLSQRFETDFPLEPFDLYRSLRRVNPAPFLFFLDYEDFAITGSSPEILVRLRGREVTIRPIAGTRKRGQSTAEDKALAKDLLSDEKELAEHLMLLDLGRNDVGRVSEIGTVQVTDEFFIEYYSHVMHIVSNVIGKLASNQTSIQALYAGFPAGTVSGAPKVRAMEIIDELEPDKRGPYAGCVGYFSANGDMDTCIVLRTAILKENKMYVQAGAGIVADSDPQSEQEECENKARALFKAAEEAILTAMKSKRGQ